MKQKKVWLMCGVPGSGKSTWARAFKASHENTRWVSRDEIRFSHVLPFEDYFAHEDEVVNIFIQEVNEAIENYENIIVDATHASPKSRKKILSKLNLANCHVTAVNFIVPLEVCLFRNGLRSGRELVPKGVVRRMWHSFIPASTTEDNIDEVITA